MGAPSEIYLRPKEEFVARFIGEATIVRGRVIAIDAHGDGRRPLRLRGYGRE